MEDLKPKDLIITPELRLQVYEEALRIFKGKVHLMSSMGFCRYFNYRHNIDVYNEEDFAVILPELFAQKPEKMYDKEDGWWFKPGNRENRIVCLENAIKLMKDENK